MKKYKICFIVFVGLIIILLCSMSATVAYNYCEMKFAIKYEGASAPASIAFLYLIPYIFGIVICSILCYVFYKKIDNKK